MSAKIEPLLTIADLEAMPDDGNRYELFEGELYVSRAPSLSHQIILANLLALLKSYLLSNPIGQAIPTPGVIFDEHDSAIPDLVFISDELMRQLVSDEKINGAPELAIEIVSPGKENARRDREVKRQVYGKHGVSEYWIIDPQNKSLEVYQLQNKTLTLMATLMDEDEVASPLLPDFSCRVSQIFAR